MQKSKILNSYHNGAISFNGTTPFSLGGIVNNLRSLSEVKNSFSILNGLNYTQYPGGIVSFCYSKIENSFWYAFPSPYTLYSCVGYQGTNCSLATCTYFNNKNVVYPQTHPVYNGSPAWDPNIWQWNASALPTFNN